MAKVVLGEKEFELILDDKIVKKTKELNVNEETIKEILQNNQEALQDENEEVIIIGNPTLTFIKTTEKIVVTNLIGKQDVY